jgi:hypothetical protein
MMLMCTAGDVHASRGYRNGMELRAVFQQHTRLIRLLHGKGLSVDFAIEEEDLLHMTVTSPGPR